MKISRRQLRQMILDEYGHRLRDRPDLVLEPGDLSNRPEKVNTSIQKIFTDLFNAGVAKETILDLPEMTGVQFVKVTEEGIPILGGKPQRAPFKTIQGTVPVDKERYEEIMKLTEKISESRKNRQMKISRRQLRRIIKEELESLSVVEGSLMGASAEEALEASKRWSKYKAYYVKDDGEVITYEKGEGRVNSNDTARSVEAADDGDVYYQGT